MKRLVLIIALGLLVLMVFVALVVTTRPGPVGRELSEAQLVALVQSNLVARLRVYEPPKPGQVGGVPVMLNEVRGTCYPAEAATHVRTEQGIRKESPFFARVQLTPELEQKFMASTNFAVVTPNPVLERIRNWFGR